MDQHKTTGKRCKIFNETTAPRRLSLLLAAIIVGGSLGGCASHMGSGYSYAPQDVVPAQEESAPAQSERQLGIHPQGLRRSAAGYILDFRYRITDPAKAVAMLDRKVRPYLLDEATGAQLGVPDTDKLGQLRTTGRSKIRTDQDYFILFANPGRFIQSGSRMTLVMGDKRIEDLVVE
ncbi:MAG: hypothetical protein PHH36_06000 [Sideroxydans sp.]|nr:hypothetical protein [Sideroxydans sp.]